MQPLDQKNDDDIELVHLRKNYEFFMKRKSEESTTTKTKRLCWVELNGLVGRWDKKPGA